MGAGSDLEPAHIWMHFQELLRRHKRYCVSPRLIDLLNYIKLMQVDGMATNFLELHLIQKIERVPLKGR